MSNPSILDPETIETLKSLNPDDNGEFLREIIGIFLEDTPQRIAELDESLLTGERNKFIRAAHSIKGSSANMGVLMLRATAEELEHLGKEKPLSELAPLVATLKQDFSVAKEELSNLKT